MNVKSILFFYKVFGILWISTIAAQKQFSLRIAITFHAAWYFDTCEPHVYRKIYFSPFYMCPMSKTFYDFFCGTHGSHYSQRCANTNAHSTEISISRDFIAWISDRKKKWFEWIIVMYWLFTYRNKKIKKIPL